MKFTSSVLLFVARHIPVGYWQLIRFAAANDPALWDYPIQLTCCPDRVLRADLRETVYTGFFRKGAIPHQLGFDDVATKLLRPGDVVFDVGANVGYTSILFSALIGDRGLVLSLEPVPRSFELLFRSCSEMRNIKCLNVAASNEPGELSLSVSNMLDRASAVVLNEGKSVTVRADTVDSLAQVYGCPKFVKIDVEGFEPAVIQGMAATLGNETPPIVIFEALNASASVESRVLIERFAYKAYSFFRIGDDGKLNRFDHPTGSSDYLALPEWALSRAG